MDFFQDTRGRGRCLLLICLFVLEAAANCPQPQLRANIVLMKEALLMNEFPDGVRVQLACANGYVSQSGAGFLTCTGGKWTESEFFICTKKDCGPPTPQPHMRFNTSGGTLFGAQVEILCDQGYEISGMSYHHCYSGGWRGKTKCEIVTCEKPEDFPNGRSLWDSTEEPKYGEVVQFVCSEGYTLIGHDKVTCSENGEFKPPPPVCSNNCPQPQLRANIVLTREALLMNEFPDGVRVQLACANGYVSQSGAGFLTCTGGKWTESEFFICTKKDCGPPTPQPHMRFNTSGGTLFGAEVEILCDQGYEISGMSYHHCYSGGWSGKTKCEIVTCEKPEDFPNGRSLWDSTEEPKYGEVVQFVCSEGYTLIGHDKVTCSENGEFKPPPPVCSIGVTTEDTNTTKTVRSSSPAPDSSFPNTAHQDRTLTTVSTASVSPSEQAKNVGAIITHTTSGYIHGIIAVISVLSVSIITTLSIHKLLSRRKGSYDTKEDRKLELLQFQNL